MCGKWRRRRLVPFIYGRALNLAPAARTHIPHQTGGDSPWPVMWPAIGCGRKRARCWRAPSGCIVSFSGPRHAGAPAGLGAAGRYPGNRTRGSGAGRSARRRCRGAQAVIEDGELVIAGTRACAVPNCAPQSSTGSNCRKAAFIGGYGCRPGATATVRRAVADGCLVITLQKVGASRG